jgi:hypothetical protein
LNSTAYLHHRAAPPLITTVTTVTSDVPDFSLLKVSSKNWSKFSASYFIGLSDAKSSLKLLMSQGSVANRIGTITFTEIL